jgi:hypothetical protein
MLSGALQRNAEHEARLSNISGCCSARDWPEIIRGSSPARLRDQNDIMGATYAASGAAVRVSAIDSSRVDCANTCCLRPSQTPSAHQPATTATAM